MGRGRRGNGREKFSNGGGADGVPADDDVIVVDESGGVVEHHDEPEVVHAEDVNRPQMREPEPEPDEAFQVLQRQFDEMKSAREAAERRAREYEERDQVREVDLISTNKALLEHAQLTANAELREAKQAFKNAISIGDYDAATEAQLAMSAAQIEVRNYELAKDQLENAIEAQKSQRGQTPQQPQASQAGDQIEEVINGLSPATQAWARKHKSDVFQPQRFQKAVSAHWAAVADGVQPDTPEYFVYLDKQMGYVAEPAVLQNSPKTVQERRPPMASAPVSRNASGAGGNQVQLTQAQREMAGRLGMTLTQYARQFRTLQEKGSDPNWRGPRLSQYDGNRG